MWFYGRFHWTEKGYCYLFSGYCVELTKKVAEFVSFDFKIKLVSDNNYGKKLSNGSWNGMIGEIIRGVSKWIYTCNITIGL